MKPLYRVGTVHGRFQPPHLDHLEYILAALEKCDYLLVGITQSNIDSLAPCPEDPHRAQQNANPLTYEEREEAISRMLVSEGVPETRFGFTRFPIETPNMLPALVPVHYRCFTTIRDDWNETKISRLKELGYEVEVLWDRRNVVGLQGTMIRNRIACGDPKWAKGLHQAVADYLITLDIANRLRV